MDRCPERLVRQVNALSYKGWPSEIYKEIKEIYKDYIINVENRKENHKMDSADSYIYSLLKEILISYYAGTFINVFRKIKRGKYSICEKCCYLDATAGIGIVPLRIGSLGKEFAVFGSAVIPLISPVVVERAVGRLPKLFGKVVLVEQDKKRMEILREVVEEVRRRLINEFSYLNDVLSDEKYIEYRRGDFNEIASGIFKKYKDDCSRWLVIIDPYGAEISINTIKSILDLRDEEGIIVDVIFNFMCGSLRRQRLKACGKNSHAFDVFFGDGSWRRCCGEKKEFGECLYKVFEDVIRRDKYEGHEKYEVRGTKVWRRDNLWHYHVVLIRRRREKVGDNSRDWLDNYLGLRKCIEKLGEKGLKQILTSNDITKYFGESSTNKTDITRYFTS